MIEKRSEKVNHTQSKLQIGWIQIEREREREILLVPFFKKKIKK